MNKLNKYLLLLSILIMLIPTVKGQNGFLIEHTDDFAVQIRDLIETADGHFICVIVRFDYNTFTYRKSSIIRVSPSGDVLAQVDMGTDSEVTVANSVHVNPLNENELIVTGIFLESGESGESYVHILRISLELEIISEVYIQVPVHFEIFRSIIDGNSHIIVAGSYRQLNPNQLSLAIGRIDQYSNLIDFNSFNYEHNQFLSDLIENKHNTGTFGLIIRGPVPNGNFTKL
jgi:hypothetical protein